MVSIRALYPGMVAFSPEIKHRFYNENGAFRPDLVRIFINLSSESENSDREFRNRNDAGRFALEDRLKRPQFKLVPTPETIKQPEKIRTLQNIGSHRQDDDTYVITQGDGRVSLVTCVMKIDCRVFTTWEGKITVLYQFLRKDFENMVDLDQSVKASLSGPFSALL